MKWRRYQTIKDYRADDPARPRLGDVVDGEKWSDAPRGVWAIPDGERRAVWVRHRPGSNFDYEIAGTVPE